MITKLQEINKRLITLSKNDAKMLEKQLLIQKILAEENCFLKMDVETAYAILRDLQIPEEELKAIYLQLI